MEVPPFLIASIATACNLQCKGCYARKNGIAADPDAPQKTTLSPDQWRAVFDEATSLGINFCLLAGGEPLTRRDILEQAAAVPNLTDCVELYRQAEEAILSDNCFIPLFYKQRYLICKQGVSDVVFNPL